MKCFRFVFQQSLDGCRAHSYLHQKMDSHAYHPFWGIHSLMTQIKVHKAMKVSKAWLITCQRIQFAQCTWWRPLHIIKRMRATAKDTRWRDRHTWRVERLGVIQGRPTTSQIQLRLWIFNLFMTLLWQSLLIVMALRYKSSTLIPRDRGGSWVTELPTKNKKILFKLVLSESRFMAVIWPKYFQKNLFLIILCPINTVAF